jgi:hypothetical protein
LAFDHCDAAQIPVAAAANRFDETRRVGVIAEGHSKVVDVLSHEALRDVHLAPYAVEDLVLGQEPLLVLGEQAQKREGLLGQGY